MRYILLDVGMPVASVLGIVIVVVVGIISFGYKKLLENLEDRVDDSEEENKKLNIEIRNMDNKINDVSRQVDTRITELNLNILEKLNDIKDKFYDLRK